MADVPHFDLPFRWGHNGHAVEAEQDSAEDVVNCVRAILSTVRGSRVEMPSFGIPDPVFEKQPLDLAVMTDAILEQEERASVLLLQNPDQFDSLVADVLVNVSVREGVQSE